MKFNKPPIPVSDQIMLLKKRGMAIDDEARAVHDLSFISYYRLRAYWLPFETPQRNDGGHAFLKGTRFEDVSGLYVFDRELRLLMLNAIERVEIALRAHWAYHMAITHGPHGYIEQRHYADIGRHKKALTELCKEFDRSSDTFAEHYRRKYSSPKLPPVWMAAEVTSFGLLSKFYGNLKRREERQAVARPFGLDEKVVKSFAHHISHVRNICAHHGRLWNKRFTIRMTVPKYPAKPATAMRGADPCLLHNTLIMLDHLLSIITPGNEWRNRIAALIDRCPAANPTAMGFPADWRESPTWRIA